MSSDFDNPISGFRDVYDWPHEWSSAYAPELAEKLAIPTFLWPNMEVWTYNNHFRHPDSPQDNGYSEWITDLYWGGDFDREQMPISTGWNIATYFRNTHGPRILRILWDFHQWKPGDTEWERYESEGGDFVDHIHIEWDRKNILEDIAGEQ